MAELHITQTVAILCDGNNIERSIHAQTNDTHAMINFDVMIPRLLNGRGLNRLIYFKEGKAISSKLAERLHNKYYGSVVPCHKSADIPLTIKATQLASKVDTIIILSGDSDYMELVKHLKSEGVRVEIAAVPENTSYILKREADYFHAITKNDWFVYTSPRQRYLNRKRSHDPQTGEPTEEPVGEMSDLPADLQEKMTKEKEQPEKPVKQVKKKESKPKKEAKPAKKVAKKAPKKAAKKAPKKAAKKTEEASSE